MLTTQLSRSLLRPSPRAYGTAIVMMNMGGPSVPSVPSVQSFLTNLFCDRDIVQLPLQPLSGPLLARSRAPKVAQLYREIGGSPILRWTDAQARQMAALLDQARPQSAPHRPYIAFRYVQPRMREALLQMHRDGVTRAVAFSQYPHFSCTTAGSSLNELWRELRDLKLEDAFSWSVIDRWPLHPAFLDAVAERIASALARFPADVAREDVHVLFSAHSVPISTVLKGDHYPGEITASVHSIMAHQLPARLRQRAAEHPAFSGAVPPYHMCWQSKVGPKQWMAPHTDEVIRALAGRGVKHLLVVPIAFTTDHIETLSEIDIEYARLAKSLGISTFVRSESLNDGALAVKALAEVVKDHLDSNQPHSGQYKQKCPRCVNPECRTIMNPFISK